MDERIKALEVRITALEMQVQELVSMLIDGKMVNSSMVDKETS